ncbi:MAG: hypothetical protein CMG00_03495 [Candidatus Marinimicrobia bacterium]|nr:hypothetical protein [Candidatus Neomarinimicrobiota bacterium]
MKLIKYLLFIVFLVVSLVFIINLMEQNDEVFIKDTFLMTDIAKEIYPDSSKNFKGPYVDQVMIKIPFSDPSSKGLKVWVFFLAVLTIGVLIGFSIALVQIVSQKREVIYKRSKLKKLQLELDTLRNQSIDEDLVLTDNFDIDKNINSEKS